MNDLDKIDFNKVIENESELHTYKKLSLDIIKYLSINNSSSFLGILKNVGGSDRRTLRLLNELVINNILLYNKGLFMLGKRRKIRYASRSLICRECEGSLTDVSPLADIKSRMVSIFRNKPKPTFIFDQRPVTLDTTIKRVAYALARGDIQDKKVAIVGDDDLTSIAISLTGVAKKVYVFDIDTRLVTFIQKISDNLKLDINVVEQDFTKEVPKIYKEYFDMFMTDPTPTKVPFTVVGNACLSLVNKDKGTGYFSIYSSAMDKNLDLQTVIHKMGLLITDIIPFFTEYDFIEETYSPQDKRLLGVYGNNKNPISFTESLVRVESTKKTRPLNISYNLNELLGKATKRVIYDLSKDPGLKTKSHNEKKYLLNIARDMKEKIDKGG